MILMCTRLCGKHPQRANGQGASRETGRHPDIPVGNARNTLFERLAKWPAMQATAGILTC